MGLLKVSSRSNPNAVAGAFAGVVREQGYVEVQVVGAGALNQAIKAVAIARSMLGAQDVDLVCIPAFAEIEIDGEPRTAMQLVVERRDRRKEPVAEQAPERAAAQTTELIVTAPPAPSDLRIETTPGPRLAVQSDGLTVQTTDATPVPIAGNILDRTDVTVAPMPPPAGL